MKKHLGQYFTTHEYLLQKVKEFTLNTTGTVLEPSCGAGHIVEYLIQTRDTRQFVCVELDTTIESLDVLSQQQVHLINNDFLQTAFEQTFSSIVGNPPYVKRKGKRNLYVEFIDRCLDLLDDHGELIFIIPSDFFTLTSASSVKSKMMHTGRITHICYPHNESLFKNAAQDVVIFRFQKGVTDRVVHVDGIDKLIRFHNGNIYFIEQNTDEYVDLSSIFDIKVGMVSGADGVFKNEEFGNVIIKSFSGNHSYIQLDILPEDGPVKDYLLAHKNKLISRRIRKFDETDWFKWGCIRNNTFMEVHSGKECLYCATITRKRPVFIKGTVTRFDGSLLCLFPKRSINLDTLRIYMNSDDFLQTFLFAGRYKLGQKSLSDCHLPIHLLV